ncbi:retrotransposon protein, putative, ty1-copia subclass, partial [Tanacetum coccineum]
LGSVGRVLEGEVTAASNKQQGGDVASLVAKERVYGACKLLWGEVVIQGLRGSRKLKRVALSLYVGDGHRAAVEAIGEFHLNNLVYFSAIPRDGIYKIDLSSSNTNDSSIYAISNKSAKLNLDSTLLWHCRLGYISKKCIEKLQNDGLLNSTDIKSFEKCVLCMSGKMAKKLYSHQVERAKDLLGLIHIDVCGPFRTVSRQGASYFITFIDDFSHYGYVYLLKHKNEVFETFKVFQKEVENQLGKTIRSLRSDRGGYPKETMGYYFYYPPENKVFVARNAEFFENSLITQEANRMCLHVDSEEHELGDLGEPANYKATLLDPESDKWLNAINVEMQTMKDNEVWDLVDLPPNDKTIGSKWL